MEQDRQTPPFARPRHGSTLSAPSSGQELEHLIVRAFELSGAKRVVWPFEVRAPATAPHVTEQLDGVVHVDGLSCLVECKDWRSNVTAGPIAKLQSQLRRRPPSTLGIVFSSRSFTRSAVYTATFGASSPILLWPGRAIETCLAQEDFVSELWRRYRFFVEWSLPYLPADQMRESDEEDV